MKTVGKAVREGPPAWTPRRLLMWQGRSILRNISVDKKPMNGLGLLREMKGLKGHVAFDMSRASSNSRTASARVASSSHALA